MGAILLRLQTNSDDPFVNEASILARAHVRHVIVPAWEDIIVERSASPFQPRPHCLPSRLEQIELNLALSLLLYNYGSVANPPARDNIADAHFDHTAPAQFAIDGEVNSALPRKRRC